MGSVKFGMEGAIQPQAALEGRRLSFAAAIREATVQAMRENPNVFVVGEGITDSGAVFGTTAGLLEEFGARRVIESPLSEAAVTGICAGAALMGMRPIYVHQRIDFALLGMDPLINHAAKWSYMYDGQLSMPFFLRCIVGKGWGQAAQHSQSLQALFAHIPGLKVIAPATPHDAKGMMLAALRESCPVVSIEARALHGLSDEVDEAPFLEPLGRAAVRREGSHVTLVAISHFVPEALKAAEALKNELSIEVIDLRSISPWDGETVMRSACKTGRVLVADTSWKSFGVSAEISARIHEECFASLKAPVMRVALPDVPTPCSPALEQAFYPNAQLMIERLRALASAGA